MRILNKKTVFDCIWFLYIAITLLALDSFNATDHFVTMGGGHLFADGLTGVFTANHFLPFLFLLQYVLAVYLMYIATRIDAAIGFFLLVVIWIMMVVDMSYQDVVGRPAGVIDIALLNSTLWHVTDIITTYIVSIGVQVLLTAILFIPLLRKILQDQRHRRNLRMFFVPLICMYGLYAGVFMVKGEAAILGYPKGFTYGFGTVSVQINHAFRQMQGADPFDARKITGPVADRIVVVIDSAVNYDDFVATRANTLPGVIDYGNAFSAANCTAASNYVLRRAGWVRNGSGGIVVKGIESWFTLALKAGYKTALVDNANVLSDPFTKLYFDENELRDIQYQTGGENALYTRDLASVDLMPGLLERKKIFIVVNKVGTHFPYENTLAPNAASGRKAYNYTKSLEVNTKGYLEKLIDVIDDGTVVFYTSDHGQNLKGAIPQCNTGKDIRRSEYTVPFLVITKHAATKKLLMSQKSAYANKLTHLEFSESVRNMMGYTVDGIDSIFKPPVHVKNIYCGLYGPPYTILDAKPQCRGLK